MGATKFRNRIKGNRPDITVINTSVDNIPELFPLLHSRHIGTVHIAQLFQKLAGRLDSFLLARLRHS